ncbi:glycosyltransferase [Hymenobacter busanensis]|uniref:Glycosyltransferase n=1 Tax=Hymenobacter busanensis TaxID=2607656 RepID=A0A7L4ZVD1_9BACT|nr:glycosyltransferase family 2 protein [Hymenobacter busanensis]KAA9332269.1 glycosyltransferase [Hymenobacter busanensis]QHJ07394.1 glycosyltransferase [Hymenobacter busanensis]
MGLKISVITINYNRSAELETTIQSVVSQASRDFEYIIIDGHSTDGSVETIKSCESNIDFWISEQDNGIYDAMNKGIAKAQGEYLVFLNSGDRFANAEVLGILHKATQDQPSIDVFYGDMLVERPGVAGQSYYSHPNKLSLFFFQEDTVNHQAAMVKASLFREFGRYPEQYQLAADFWLFLRAFVAEKQFYHIPKALVVYDFAGVSAQDGFKKYKEEQRHIWKDIVLAPAHQDKYLSEVADLLEKKRHLVDVTNYKLVRLALRIDKALKRLAGIFRRQ